MKESAFQHSLIHQIKELFPGCMVLKNDPNYIQGVPDLLILYKGKWAALECKRGAKEAEACRPNQKYYIDSMNRMSYASFVYPENREEVLYEMARSFGLRRSARISVPK